MTDHLPRLQEEYVRALAKHPAAEWAVMPTYKMIYALEDEVRELQLALWKEDLTGPHGIEAEALHCAIISLRIIQEMTKRMGLTPDTMEAAG